MSPAKKQASSAWLRSGFAWLRGAGRPAMLTVLLVGLFFGGTYVAWRKLKPRIVALPEYQVGLDQVEITPQPAWIHADVRGEVFRDARLDGTLSLMDDDLVERIKNAFAEHPWVAKVARVAKRHPGAGPTAVLVELVYRRPVCMVEVPDGAYAVDAAGVLLPSKDFYPVEAARYPHLKGVDRDPIIPAGRKWTDARVVGGAEIADALTAVWDSMRLSYIVAQPHQPTSTAEPGHRALEPVFLLLTRTDGVRGGTQIRWGYAPGANVPGELSVAEKVGRLKQYVAEHDSLDDPQGRPLELDIRTMGHGNP